jgi:hypothetical protein
MTIPHYDIFTLEVLVIVLTTDLHVGLNMDKILFMSVCRRHKIERYYLDI